MTKKIVCTFLCTLMLVSFFSACNKASSETGSLKNYKEIIESLRDSEENKAFPVVEAEDDKRYDMSVEVIGVQPSDMQKYAISVSFTIVQAYGVVIILPAEGKAEAVEKALASFIDSQKKAFENYLPDQYEIAKKAKVEIADTGEVVLVMHKDSATLVDEILKKLKV